MNRGANRSSIFFDDNDRIEVGQRLAEIHELFEIEVHAYCLMANHFHWLLHCPNGGLSPYLLNACRYIHRNALYVEGVNVAEVLKIPTRGACRTALSSARPAVATRNDTCKAVEITLSLVG